MASARGRVDNAAPARASVPGRRSLNRKAVLTKALEIVDAEGIEALGMRRLAAEVGIEPMSLYHHVNGKEALLDGVVEEVFAQVPPIEPGVGPWPDQIRSHAQRFRDVLLRHPNAAGLVASRPVMNEVTISLAEAALANLEAAGLDPDRARHVLSIIVSFVVGSVLAEVAETGRVPGRSLTDIRTFLDTLPVDRYPRTAASFDLSPPDHDARFAMGLDLLITGITSVM